MRITIGAALHRAARNAGTAAGQYRARADRIGGMLPYASCTQGARNLAALRAADWRILCSPSQPKPPPGFGYALDNGAWSLYTSGGRWNKEHESGWATLVDRIGTGADWVVLPDIVCGGSESLSLSLSWLPRLHELTTLLIPVQDGMEDRDVAGVLSPGVGLFIGGSTEWKLATVGRWIRLAQRAGAWCHVGRVNSGKRIRLIRGATSFDGTSATRFSCTVAPLDSARNGVRKQQVLF